MIEHVFRRVLTDDFLPGRRLLKRGNLGPCRIRKVTWHIKVANGVPDPLLVFF
jgi:hypothetical protein